MFLPVLGHLDGLLEARLALHRHALLVGVIEHLVEVVRVHGVQHVIKVLPRGTFALRILVREELQHLFIAGELRPDVLDGQLVVEGDLDERHLLLPEQLLLLREQLLEEVLVDSAGGRQVELDYKRVRYGR